MTADQSALSSIPIVPRIQLAEAKDDSAQFGISKDSLLASGMPSRVIRALQKAYIFTAEQLIKETRRSLLGIHGIGERSVMEIENYLTSQGRALSHVNETMENIIDNV
jgi:DNA-directed RNA polymerase alpha subunit